MSDERMREYCLTRILLVCGTIVFYIGTLACILTARLFLVMTKSAFGYN